MKLQLQIALAASLVALASAADFPRVDEACMTDTDCFADFEYCSTDKLVCKQKDLNDPNGLEIAGYFVTVFILLLSNMGGLGGGGSMITVAIFFFGFDIKQSIGLSNASIAVASICRYIQNFRKPHPLKDGTGILVDYNVASLMLPMIVVGATLGVMFNKILPTVAVAGIFAVLMTFVSVTTLLKLLKIQADERAKLGPVCGKKKAFVNTEMVATPPQQPTDVISQKSDNLEQAEKDQLEGQKPTNARLDTDLDIKSQTGTKEKSAELEHVIKRDSTNLNWVKLTLNVGMLLVMLLTKMIRGPGNGLESVVGLDICDPAAWGAFAALIVVAFILTFIAYKVSNKEFAEKTRVGYNFTRGDVHMDTRNSIKLILIAFFAAFFAAVCGAGPGAIFNSVMVQMDMHPAVASATGMYLTMFTTLAASINLIINEKLNLPFSLVINILTIVGTIPGLFGQVWLVKATGGRNQFTVMILLSFLVFSLVTALPLSIIEAVRASDSGQDVSAFTSFCE